MVPQGILSTHPTTMKFTKYYKRVSQVKLCQIMKVRGDKKIAKPERELTTKSIFISFITIFAKWGPTGAGLGPSTIRYILYLKI